MSLQRTIADWQAENIGRIPEDLRGIMQQATQELIDQGIAGRAVQPGERAVGFELPTFSGRLVRLEDQLEQGPVVLNFFRGAWCPYCNMELKALDAALPEIHRRGASLLSISPNLPQATGRFVAENPFGFDVLCDVDNQVARRYGLVFRLPKSLVNVYSELGLDLPAFDGNHRWELPMPATYVVGPDGLIHDGFVHADYTRRMEPAAILAALDRLQAGDAADD